MTDPAVTSEPNLTCEQVASWASAYLNGHIDDAERVRVVLHVAACSGCDAYVKQIAAVQRMLGLLPDSVPSSPQMAQLQRAFAAQHAGRVTDERAD